MISVCLASHNGSQYIREQIASILQQLSAEDELIISDDGSTDDTIDIIKSFNDERIKLLFYKQDEGLNSIKHCKGFYYATANFENALSHAKGEYIFLSDQDDIWEPDKVAEFVKALKEHAIVMSDFAVCDKDGNITEPVHFVTSPLKKSVTGNVIKSRFTGCAMAFRKEVLDYCLPFPEKLYAHDYWIGCYGMTKFDVFFLAKPLHRFRRTGENVSSGVAKSTNSLYFKVSYRIEQLMRIRKRQREARRTHAGN